MVASGNAAALLKSGRGTASFEARTGQRTLPGARTLYWRSLLVLSLFRKERPDPGGHPDRASRS
jgi:hypothetical protein